MKAVLYTRVSTEDQAENGTSLETQELACLRKAAEVGAQVIETFRDEGISGARYMTRARIQDALCAIEAGKANALIVYSLSRLSRDVEHQQAIKKRIARAKATLIICDMPLEDTEEGDLMFGVKGSFDQYERKLIRKRTMSGRKRNAEKGLMPYRAISPYGYHIINTKDVLQGLYPLERVGKYEIIEEDAEIVRQIFARAAGGASLRSLGIWLDESGVRTRRGAPYWQPVVIRAMLNNPTYKGTVFVGRHEYIQQEEGTQPGMKQKIATRWRDESECILINIPALVEEAMWNACQSRLATNRGRMSGPRGRRHLLSGVMVCPACGKRMKGATSKGVLYYRCYEETFCPYRKHTRGEMIDGLITDFIARFAEHPELLEAKLRAYVRQAIIQPTTEIRDALIVDFNALQKREAATVQAQISGIASGADPSLYADVFAEIAAKKAVLQKRIDASQVQTQEETFDPADTSRIIAQACADVHTALNDPDLTPDDKNRALSIILFAIYPPTEGETYRLDLAPLPNSGLTVSKVSTCLQVGAVVSTTLFACE